MKYTQDDVVVIFNGEQIKGLEEVPEIKYTEVKQCKPSDSFMAYTAYIKYELDRQLTKKEYEIACQYYINGKNVDLCVDKLKKGE